MIVDIAHRIEPDARFFYLDTELLFPETYETRDALAERYGIEFERFAGIPPRSSRERGANLWRLDPDACCADRKVELMRQALDGVELLGLGGPPGRLARHAPTRPSSAGTSGSASGS